MSSLPSGSSSQAAVQGEGDVPSFAARQDRELLALTRGGDTGAFDEVVKRYRGRVYALASALLPDRRNAADATVDVFLAAYRDCASRPIQSTVQGWIFGHTMHAIRSRR
jgi:RNA polymerase sigma-70 factor (ECF subfamily)